MRLCDDNIFLWISYVLQLMVVSVLVGSRSMSVSILDGFWIRSRAKKFICPLSSCIGLNFMSGCVWFVMTVIQSGHIFLESYIIRISCM